MKRKKLLSAAKARKLVEDYRDKVSSLILKQMEHNCRNLGVSYVEWDNALPDRDYERLTGLGYQVFESDNRWIIKVD